MSEWNTDTLLWQEANAHIKRRLEEPCPFCGTRSADLWFDPIGIAASMMPFQVRCLCGARGPRCDCGEESAVPSWLSVAPLSAAGVQEVQR